MVVRNIGCLYKLFTHPRTWVRINVSERNEFGEPCEGIAMAALALPVPECTRSVLAFYGNNCVSGHALWEKYTDTY